jgi:hypothetical protein
MASNTGRGVCSRMITMYGGIGSAWILRTLDVSTVNPSAGGKYDLARQPAGVVRGKEYRDLGDIRRRSDTAQRCHAEPA